MTLKLKMKKNMKTIKAPGTMAADAALVDQEKAALDRQRRRALKATLKVVRGTAVIALLAGSVSAQTDPRAQIFVERGCRDCHAISALKMKASTDVGPDLTYAYGDVLRRYGLNLESFMANPTGVMRLMLASHLRLSLADRDSIVGILRGVYEERRADAETGVPTLPWTRIPTP